MTDLEQVRAWLENWPGMERLGELRVDDVGTAADSGGLFPRGAVEVERREDILGNVEALNRERFRVCFVFSKAAGDQTQAAANAEWLQSFQDWVQERGAQGQLPQVGGAGAYGWKAKAERGALRRQAEDGTATYTVALTIDFKKRYEVS